MPDEFTQVPTVLGVQEQRRKYLASHRREQRLERILSHIRKVVSLLGKAQLANCDGAKTALTPGIYPENGWTLAELNQHTRARIMNTGEVLPSPTKDFFE